ncbi:MAG: GNAT family N-acetyltransferase [Defluviitaleaceae bacterium]|nr:GNAT family N-acetyltransferase [Defluviitaleaceae bacterium]
MFARVQRRTAKGETKIIEILKPEDLASYKNLIDECFGSSNHLDKYRKYSENQAYTIFVIKDGDDVIGSVTQYTIDLFTFRFQPCLMVFNVAVKPSHRGQKIAQRLLQHVIENAKEDGYGSVSLTCLDDAYSAHNLYENLGFKKAGSVKYDLYF